MAAGAALVLACPFVTWWLIGDLTFQKGTAYPGDFFLYRPPPISPAAELAIGIASSSVALLALAVLIYATIKARFDSQWWLVLSLLIAAGMVVGAAERVMTAGVVGANIGGGLAAILGPPIVAVLVIVAAVLARSILCRVKSAGQVSQPPAGYYRDPTTGTPRWWDGQHWQ